jgi:hypothetical protein
MIDIDTLEIGRTVRLASGSPKMVVLDFITTISAGPRNSVSGRRVAVKVLMWSERHGFIERILPPYVLVFPRALEPEVSSDAAPESEAA